MGDRKITLVLPGEREEGPEKVVEQNDYLRIEVLAAHRVDVTVRGEAQPPESEREAEAEETDVVEMEFENGIRRWVPISRLPQEVRPFTTARGEGVLEIDPSRIVIPATLGAVGETRGKLKDFALKTIKLLGLPSVEDILEDVKSLWPQNILAHWLAQPAARLIARGFEGGFSFLGGKLTVVNGKLKPGAGLYRFSNPVELDQRERVEQASELPGTDPFLLFIHGTFSSCPGAFFALEKTEEWRAMQGRYPNRILAFNHPTLSVSPIENALVLAKLLPARARLHLVSHSRGGLIGDLLALPPVKGDALADLVRPFAESVDFPVERKNDEEMLRELIELLAQKSFQIERYVRVACPARGTLLADDRLDTYVSAVLNAIGLAVGSKANPYYDFARAFALALLKCKANPGVLPGLEAQRSKSPMIHLLNRPGLSTGADLSVISGDIEGGGVLGNVIAGVSNLFYLKEHDLVVNTDSMDGGLQPEGGTRFLLDQGPGVGHSNYFKNERTRKTLWNWLDKKEKVKPEEVRREMMLDLLKPPETRAAGAAERPIVFILPGLMGSHLRDKNGRVWLDPLLLSMGGMARLKFENGSIQPHGIVAIAYQRLIDFLSVSYQVIPFDYDWRQSIQESSARLALEVQKQLDLHQRPIRFIAHSMGGLVVRAMIAQKGNIWKQICERGGRLVMLGTPNRGTYAIPRMFLGKERLLRLLELFDFKHTQKQLVGLISQYPGLLEMLPDEYFDAAKLNALKPLVELREAALNRARGVRDSLAKAVDSKGMIYVAGSSASTPCQIVLKSDGKTLIEATMLGDGRVTYDLDKDGYVINELGLLRTYYMDAEHGDMADHPPAFAALLELLDRGETSKLADAPRMRRGDDNIQVLREDDLEIELFPKTEEIIREALGGGRERNPVFPIHIKVSHGDLRYASYPLAVGHYQSDSIVSAEKALDERLGNRLSQRFNFNLDMYPGRNGTTEVVYVPDAHPPGALIIGLGEVGEVTQEKVRNGVARAALRYALTVMDDPMARTEDGNSWRPAAFSSLLLGTYGGQALSIENSLSAIVEGAILANHELQAQGLWDRVRINEVEIIELYEDVAIQAMRSAVKLTRLSPSDLSTDEKIEVTQRILITKEGGLFHRPANQYATGWWRRVQITGKERDGVKGAPESTIKDLQFTALTDRARAEDTLQSTQRGLVDRLIKAAIDSPVYDERLGTALFELLVPNTLKERANTEANVVLIVDDESAQYPWELMAEWVQGIPQPLAVRKGYIRQFKTADFRPNPQAARDQHVLVIGDPKNDFSQLPGAEMEAEMVAAKIAGYLEPDKVHKVKPQSEALTIINELFAREYNIIHLAGHGMYDPGDPGRSGMVLSDGLCLSVAELKQLRVVPDLVFINCCHLGKIDRSIPETREESKRLKVSEPNKLAASISQELIKMGVKAIIAAGWAVDDLAATTFAGAFYDAMLSGSSFGDAVRGARKAVHDNHKETNTWGAYQCYGNPGFTLASAKHSSVWKASEPKIYYSRSEYYDVLQSISFNVRHNPDRRTELLEQLKDLRRGIPENLLDGEMFGLFARTSRDLDDLKGAIEFYRQAIVAQTATASLRDVEQLANLESRYARLLLSKGISGANESRGDKSWKPHDLLEASNQRLDGLLMLGRTVERLSVLAANYKRLARLTEGSKRSHNLKMTEKGYRAAFELARQRKDSEIYYPALNWVACAYLNSGSNRKTGKQDNHRRDWLDAISAAEKDAAQREQSSSSYWTRVTKADALLTRHLVDGNWSESEQKKVINAYRSVFDTGAWPAEKSSTLDHIDFLIEMLTASKRADRQQALKALENIRKRLSEK
jgi:pimeloyl-ACP methyl ester carboxylesterase